jgi:uridine kinase
MKNTLCFKTVSWAVCFCVFLCKVELVQGKTVTVGIAGMSGSGKTTLAGELKKYFEEHHSSLKVCQLSLDQYYNFSDYSGNWYDQNHELGRALTSQWKKAPDDRGWPNFDHPSALDFNWLSKDINSLKQKKTVQAPIYKYDMKVSGETVSTGPCDLVIVEGIHTFHDQDIRESFDFKIFVSLPEQTCLERRIKRDLSSRDLAPQMLTELIFEHMVLPMHAEFIERFGEKEALENQNIIEVDGSDSLNSDVIQQVAERLKSLF